MKTADFSFDLPDELVAQRPSGRRDRARLMVLDRRTGETGHHRVADLPQLLAPGTVMVFNDSRVRKARLVARVAGGDSDREFLLVRQLPDSEVWEAMTRKPSRLRVGTLLEFPGRRRAAVIGHREMFVHLRFDSPLDEAYFASWGHVPLPPYIARDDEEDDESRYQTVYAREPGSVAAPTAGLHFTPELLERIEQRGIQIEWVRLHVGIGTFLPVRVEEIERHEMHEERCELRPAVADRINAAREAGRPILAVGTTSVRTLESAWDGNRECLVGFCGETRLFIRPGYRFRVVDALFTNFHTPRSTLLMLVSAFAGRERVLAAYEEAVRRRYRFYSYGDAMLIRQTPQ